jgi:TolB protein
VKRIAAALVLALAVCTGAAGQPDAVQKISFWSDRGGFPGVWLMGTDGKRPQLLTPRMWAKRGVWSPDGRRLVFDGPIGGRGAATLNFDLFVMNADGSGKRRLTRGPERDVLAAWSPDGKTIAFTRRARRDGVEELWLVRPDGTALRRLRQGSGPVWSPDGAKLAFTDLENERAVAKVLDLASGEVLQLTDGSVEAVPSDWSRDGSSLLITRYPDGRSGDIYVMHAEGSALRRLTRTRADELDPTWSPDGKRILFSSDRTGNKDVYVMRADGTRPVNLTKHPAEDWATDWRP